MGPVHFCKILIIPLLFVGCAKSDMGEFVRRELDKAIEIPDNKKPPRDQCPPRPNGCGGTGKLVSGDGYVTYDCDLCEAPKKTYGKVDKIPFNPKIVGSSIHQQRGYSFYVIGADQLDNETYLALLRVTSDIDLDSVLIRVGPDGSFIMAAGTEERLNNLKWEK